MSDNRIHFQCTNCGKKYSVDPKYAGKSGRCKKCGVVITVPLEKKKRNPTKSIYEKLHTIISLIYKKPVYISIIAILFISIFFVGYRYNQKRHLREAEARLKINDYENAINSLKMHLLKFSNDSKSRLLLANSLSHIGKNEDAIAIYDIILRDNIKNKRSPNYIYALIGRINTISDICEKYKNSINIKIENKLYASADSLLLKLIELQRNKILNRKDLLNITSIDSVRLFLDYHDYNLSIARRALVNWLSGDKEETKSIVSYSYDVIDYLLNKNGIKQRLFELAFLLSDEANKKFNSSDYRTAANLYKAATYFRVKANNGIYDDEASRCKFNQAISFYNIKEYWRAQDILKELQRESPDYDSDKINKLIKDTRTYGTFQSQINLFDDASRKFDNKDWIGAISGFQDYIEYCKKSGVSPYDERIAVAKYNIAIAFGNDKKYKKASLLMKELRKNFPSYKPDIIEEQIKKYERLAAIFE